MLVHVLTLVIALIGPTGQQTNSTAQVPADASQKMSLAERAATARKAAAEKATGPQPSGSRSLLQPLTPEQRGVVRNNVYVNDFLHFRIDLGEWQLINDEFAAFDAARPRLTNGGSANGLPRPHLARDGARRMAVLTIIGLPQALSKDLGYWTDFTKNDAVGQLTSVQDLTGYKEPELLGDVGHKFAAFRVAGNLRDLALVRSEQLTISDGFLIKFEVTGPSHDDVSAALHSLKTGMIWTAR
jgi:hypothetical protein